MTLYQWHKRNIFQAGQSHSSRLFPSGVKRFFPVEISILVHPKQISVVSKCEKKKERKKKSPLLGFILFYPSITNFPPSISQFFLLFCPFPFFPCLCTFPGRSQKIPGEKRHSAPFPCPCPLPASYATALNKDFCQTNY